VLVSGTHRALAATLVLVTALLCTGCCRRRWRASLQVCSLPLSTTEPFSLASGTVALLLRAVRCNTCSHSKGCCVVLLPVLLQARAVLPTPWCVWPRLEVFSRVHAVVRTRQLHGGHSQRPASVACCHRWPLLRRGTQTNPCKGCNCNALRTCMYLAHAHRHAQANLAQ
jgi:hypothetical protein